MDDLDVVDRIRIEMDTSGVGDRRNQRGRDIQICLFEFEYFDLAGDETDCRVLCSLMSLPVARSWRFASRIPQARRCLLGWCFSSSVQFLRRVSFAD